MAFVTCKSCNGTGKTRARTQIPEWIITTIEDALQCRRGSWTPRYEAGLGDYYHLADKLSEALWDRIHGSGLSAAVIDHLDLELNLA